MDVPHLAELEAAGLYDPAAPRAEERRALLEFLTEQGVTVEAMVQADHEERLPWTAADALIRGPAPRLTLGEAAAKAGTTREKAARVWRTLGLAEPAPDARLFSDATVEAFQLLIVAEALLGEELALQLARVYGSATARIAEAEVSAFSLNVFADVLERGGELELAQSQVQVAALLPLVARTLDVLHQAHLDAAILRLAYTVEAVRSGAQTRPLAIGFVDLVGFTARSQELLPSELESLVRGFEARAGEAVMARGGHVVKMIGDEVMFVAPGPGPACDIALAMVDRVADPEQPLCRGGLAFGDVMPREGDYYGPVVNLAARLAGVAPEGRVVVAAALRDQLDVGQFHFEALGPRELKGFADPIEVFALQGRA